MPVVEVAIWDLERLVGAELPKDELLEYLTALKGEVEELTEVTLTFEASHDRPDFFSAEGLARAISFLKGVRKPAKYSVESSGISLDVSEAPTYRPYALLAVVRNLELDDEAIRQFFQLQEKLHASYCGDRALVSIGLYDLDKLKPPIRFVAVKEASFIPLGYGKRMKLSEILKETEKGIKYGHLVRKGEYPLLVDSEGQVLSLAPIINNEENKVTEETRNVVIDVTGVEPKLMMKVLNVVTTSVAMRGKNTRIESVVIRGAREDFWRESPQLSGFELSVNLDNVSDLLGFALGLDRVKEFLNKAGYIIEGIEGNAVKVWVPPYRVDVLGWADVAEDLAIIYGYNRIPLEATSPTHFGEVSDIERFSDLIREIMVGLGFDEVVNFMLIDEDVLEELNLGRYVAIENVKMKTYSAIRNSLIPSLLLTASVNAEKVGGFKVFEVGDIVRVEGSTPTSIRMVGFAIHESRVTLTDGLVTIKSLFNPLAIKYELRECNNPVMIEGRCAEVVVQGSAVGIVGEVHPKFLVRFGLRKPLVLGEVNLQELVKHLERRLR